MTDKFSDFNSYAIDFRSKVENLLKQVLLVSGGIQAITIGAFLSGKAPKITESIVNSLEYGWWTFSISIICCISVMSLQVASQAFVLEKKANTLKSKNYDDEIMGPLPLVQWLNYALVVVACICCIVGIYKISEAAISLIKVSVSGGL